VLEPPWLRALITQLIKGSGPVDRLPTRLVGYVVALIVANIFTRQTTVGSTALCVVNATVVVELTRNGGYDALAAKKGS